MKLLLDQNLSPRLCERLRDICPNVVHVRAIGLQAADDDAIWKYAAQNGFIIVTKDADFNSRAFLFGAPPKVVWIQRGNCSTRDLESFVRGHAPVLVAFDADAEAGLLVLK